MQFYGLAPVRGEFEYFRKRSAAPTRSSAVVEREPDFEGDLVVRNLTFFDMAARLHHLKRADLLQSARRTADARWIASLMLFSEDACDFR